MMRRLCQGKAALRTADDRGSLVLSLLVSTVGVLAGGLVASMVVGQVRSTGVQEQRLGALQAAQSGLDVGMAAVQSSFGLKAALPCAPSNAPLAGSVGAVGASPRFQVVIQYFQTDPANQSDSWRATNAMTCTVGIGVSTTPAFAGLVSTGTGRSTGSFSAVPTRRLGAIYTFSMANQKTGGGLVRLWRDATDTASLDLCLDAGSSAPATLTTVTTEICNPTDLGQRWAYNANLTLSLTPSQSVTTPLGMCLQAGTGTVGSLVQVQPCAATTSRYQQWGFNDAASFQGTSDGIKLDGLCFKAQTQNLSGSGFILAADCAAAYNRRTTFSPEAAVGAGMAAAATKQLVNYEQFGRCLDVPDAVVTATFLIDGPCQQLPAPSAIIWNQKWALPILPNLLKGPNAKIGTITSNSTYCLQSPGMTALGQYVTIKPCVLAKANQQWTTMNVTGQYKTAYTIVDYLGYCLTPRNPNSSDPDYFQTATQISKIYVATCDGSALQKWNAPPGAAQSRVLKNVTE